MSKAAPASKSDRKRDLRADQNLAEAQLLEAAARSAPAFFQSINQICARTLQRGINAHGKTSHDRHCDGESEHRIATAQCAQRDRTGESSQPFGERTARSCHARNAPAIPASTLTSRLSKRKSRTTLRRDAPIAIRNAISRRRPLNLTRSRFATLLHAINRTNATAASKVANAGRKFPVTSLGRS